MTSVPPIFSVSDFLASVNQTLEYAYQAIEIEGEVASFKVSQQKFVFFDIKDSVGSVGCFMTVWQLRVPLEDGMRVVIRAVPKMTNWGKFSLTVQSVRPSGEGAIKKVFELLKDQLEKDGLFATERKRQLPNMPQRIAVVSSVESAGYADFMKIINQRWGGMQIEVAHVQVQGEVAAEQIINAIQYFNAEQNLAEVIVLIRGGGSADDLAVFNDERLVRAIAASRIPTLLGIGHETDTSLADLVADVRAATPSNAAQILVPDRQSVGGQVQSYLRSMASRVEWSVDGLLAKLNHQQQKMLDSMIGQAIKTDNQRSVLLAQLNGYNPTEVLRRGYSLVRGEVEVGSMITIERQLDEIIAEVLSVKRK